MAGTEDVAREVADVLFDQSVKIAGMASNVVPRALQGISSVASVSLGQVIDELKKNKALKEMLGLEGEISAAEMTELIRRFSQRSSSVMVADTDAKDYAALLKDQGVLYAMIDRQDDDCKLFIFLNRDLSKVEDATRILQAQRGQVTELNSRLYFNSLSPDKVHVVECLSAVEMELYRHYARAQGLLFTSISKKDGDMVICSAEDEKKARRALLYTGWALTGVNGARIREQIERRLSGRTAINIAAEEGERELYILSRNDPRQYVHISSEDLAVYKRSKQVSTVSRKDPDFYAKCIAACESLAHPVVVSAEQFQAGISQEELQNAHTIDLFPDDHDDMVQMAEVNRLINLVAMKSGLDDEHNATWGLWDTSVTYSDFAAYEHITDEDERDARAYAFEHFKDAAFYSKEHHETYDVDMQEKSVDYIIAKAEEQRRQQAGEQSYQPERFGPSQSSWEAEENER